jgi:ADP-heptose:LPS heptosyltransferase
MALAGANAIGGDLMVGGVPDVEKIAVLRAGGLGDLLFAFPALEALRAAYPSAEIALLGSLHYAPLIEERSSPVDRLVPLPVTRGVFDPAGSEEDPAVIEAFLDRMRFERFDLALQMHGGGRHSNALVRSLGARVTAGCRTPNAPPLDREVPYVYYQWEIARWLEVAGLVGARPVTLEPRLEVTARDREEADAVLPPGDGPLAVLHPGAGDPRRRWPAERFALVGDVLADQGAEVAVAGGGAEQALVGEVIERMRAPAVDLAGRLSLHGLAGLLSRCAVYVGNDSGPLHLAAAVGARTVGIYWCGNHINAAPATRSRHRPAISWILECPVCGVNSALVQCPHEASFITGVTVDEVAEPARSLLADACGESVLDRESAREAGVGG